MMGQPTTADILKQIDIWLAKSNATTVPAMRLVRRTLSRELAEASARTVLSVADSLVKRGSFVDRLLAYETVAEHPAAWAALDGKRVVRWAAGLNSWDTVDLFACTVSGQAWREGIIADSVINQWSASPDRWKRRLALASTIPLNSKARGGNGDADRTLRVCTTHLDDRDDMVVKSLSWALRELAKRDSMSVQRFLAKHNVRLAARIRREVKNKLTTGMKNPK